MEMKEKRSSIEYIRRKAGKVKGKIVALTILNLLFAFFAVVFALCCKGIVDGATEGNKDKIILYAVLFLTIILIQFTLRLVISYLYEKTKSQLLKDFRQHFFGEILNKEYGEISSYHSGEILNRLFTDIEIISEGITDLIPEFVNMATRLLTALIVLFVLDYLFALIFLLAGIFLFFVAYFYRKKIKNANREVLNGEDKMRAFYQENVGNSLIIKVYGSQKKAVEKGEEIQKEYVRARMKRRILSMKANSGFSLIFNGFYLFALIWGAVQIYSSDFVGGYGSLVAMLELISQISGPVANLSSLVPQAYTILVSAERLIEIENLPEEKEENEPIGAKEVDEIVFSGVTFRYREEPVLEEATFTIGKGDFVAVTGLSGGGKTTLFHLLLGVYAPERGTISIRLEEKKHAPGKALRGLFGYLPQGNSLFSGTIRDNLTYFNENVGEKEIFDALKTACAYDFVSSLEEGLDTRIGEKGLGLSEGQSQRLALARTLIHPSSVLLLDEATSALDEQTEAEVLKNLSRLNKTVLIVTHRKKALSYCNKQLIIDERKVSMKKREESEG